MPQPCTVCASPMRKIVDREHLAGSSYNAISRLVGSLTAASIRRHCEAHLRRPSLFPESAQDAARPTLGDIADRWAESIRDVERVRDDARERGDARLVLQASTARGDMLEKFAARFGGNLSAGVLLRRGEGFADTLAQAIHDAPDIGAVLVAAASAQGHPDLAAELEEHARLVREKKENHE